jgi:DNA primase
MKTTSYRPEYCEMLIKHMSGGFSYETFGAEVNCGRTTLYDWELAHPEWAKAKREAMEAAQKFFEQRLMVKVAGKDLSSKGIDPKLIDTACLIFALKTRFHKTYSEKKEIELEHKGAINLNYKLD